MTPQTTAVVLIAVVIVGGAAVYVANKKAKEKVAQTAYQAAKPQSIDIGVRLVGGKLLNRDGSPATFKSIDVATKSAGVSGWDFYRQKA